MIDIQDIKSVDRVADWIELYVLFYNRRLSKSKIISILGKLDDEPNEGFMASIFGELTRRTRLYNKHSPYKIDGNVIKPLHNWREVPEFVMCLIFSLTGVVKKKGQDDGTKFFELLSREAIVGYLGGEAEVIGFPTESKLVKQIAEISKKMNETVGIRTPKPKDKDKGVDILAWKPHGDLRNNQLILLLQCGAGWHFDDKKPISETAWREFINWSAEPTQGIMIPIVVNEEDWIELRDDYNLIFDRARILTGISLNRKVDNNLKKEILKWCRAQLN